jgi:hypothetical protein
MVAEQDTVPSCAHWSRGELVKWPGASIWKNWPVRPISSEYTENVVR